MQIELVGDYGARALLDAQIIRATATSKLQAQIAAKFVNLSTTQKDDLVLVIYSDVKEWYSQKRADSDDPIASFKFIATSLKRVFQEFRPAAHVAVRKQVQASAYLFWEGWGELSYPARITELGLRDLRLELDTTDIDRLEELQATQPLLGILVVKEPNDPAPQSLVAEVKQVEVLEELSDRTVIELSFPTSLNSRQKNKIRQLLKILS
uniref:Uncharacterized protein n=1 Tax=Oscillatoriales cyanobacterium SpSt-418 TaxID=2282169 RepID=A0A7C3KE12_9CYAN